MWILTVIDFIREGKGLATAIAFAFATGIFWGVFHYVTH